MPVVEVFLDSNVVLYALADEPSEQSKRDRVAEILATAQFGISYQVLMEIWVTATRKFKRPVAEDKVLRFIENLLEFPCVEGSAGLYRQAALVSRRYDIHPYDAAIVAAARELEAPMLYSEDLNHGQVYAGVQLVNPFRDLTRRREA
jgi:predicted nucleic acid-binding protein